MNNLYAKAKAGYHLQQKLQEALLHTHILLTLSYRMPHVPQTVTLGGPLSQPLPSAGVVSVPHTGAAGFPRASLM
jgi:hypothetical protein